MTGLASERSGRLAGWFEGGVHVCPVRVYYEDTDAGGIVYYANYLRFAERGRTEFLRALELGQQQLRDENGLMFAVRRVEVDYELPARLDDLLDVRTRIVHLGGARLEMGQEILRGETRLVSMMVQVVSLDSETTRARRLSGFIRDILMPYSQS
ncbi:tol-pal system-associated acyl-CoA thioesterase [Fodinicurvata halophila]|uniref:Tol-pal system-associated acyl-CoA thioesterase n=1 Tax=Fodinicurvata halophila TaxID=1419723 RepID=A0ABV8UIE5_9PROT